MNIIKKNIKHFENFLDYIKEHILCIIVIIIIFIISFAILKLLPKSMPKEVQSQEIYIFGISLSNVGGWFTGVGLVITAFWSMYQYTKNVARKQQEKAALIAKEFNNGLLLKCGIVTMVYKKSKLYTILNSHQEYNNFKNFTISELQKIYDHNLPSIYRDLEKKENLDNIYYEILDKRLNHQNLKTESKNEEKNKNTTSSNNNLKYSYEEIEKLFVFDNKNLPFRFATLVDDVLNELEYLCMDISSQAAGSKYIYQSLHQIFFTTIKVLSIEICLRNDGKYADKYYTNIIHVYNEWTNIYKRDLKKENARKQKANKLQERIIKLLNPKIKTV